MKKLIFCILFTFIIFVTGKTQVLDVPVCGQETNHWCVQACISAVLAYYKINVSQCELKELQRTRDHWWIAKNNCCADAYFCNKRTTYGLAGREGDAEDILYHYGIKTKLIPGALTMDEIRNEIENGRPFIINEHGTHAMVCYGIDGDRIKIMDPDLGGSTDSYRYENYVSICYENLIITCINEIELYGALNKVGKSYIYNAAQSLKIQPGTKIENVEFFANVTGSTECENYCIPPTCQIVLNGNFIKLHVRNGQSYNYTLVNNAGSLISTGSGTLNSSDEEVVLCHVATAIYIMQSITITSNCGIQRTLYSYKIPYYSD